MKVLMINEVCGITSTGRICADIAEMLSECGYECKIGYGRNEVPEQYKKYAVRIGNDVGNYVHALESRIFDDAGFHSQKATINFIKFIEKYESDIIHLHNLHGYYLHIGVLFEYLKTIKVPVVWTLHDCWPLTGHCTCADYIGCEKWKKQCEQCPQKGDYPKSIFLDNSHKNYIEKKRLFTGVADLHIVTPSNWLKNQVEQSYLSEYDMQVIPSGIDTSIFTPRQSHFREENNLEGKTILLAVANAWSGRKGIKEYISLANDLESNYQLVMVGDLRGEAVPDNILCINHTNSQAELAEIYSSADVFLNFSYEETQGLTTIEALACGTPVIVANRTAIPECVDDTCGVVIDKYEKEAFKSALAKVGTIRSRDCVNQAKKYKKTDRFEEYIRLYERLAE